MLSSPIKNISSVGKRGKLKRKINKSPNSSNTSHKGLEKCERKLNHCLAAEMGMDMNMESIVKMKKNRKRQQASPVNSVPDDGKIMPVYEHRTVNSAADITKDVEDDVPAVPRKRVKRKKPELTDSEVDLMRTDTPRPPLQLPTLKPKLLVQAPSSENDCAPKNIQKRKKKKSIVSSAAATSVNDPADKYPVLKNEELVQRFLKVDFTNNQKGRVRQVIREILRGTSSTILPDVINNKIQTILNSSEDLTDSDLRKIRVLYNMLKKATEDIHRQSVQSISDNSVFKAKQTESIVKEDKLEDIVEKNLNVNEGKSKDKNSKMKVKEDKAKIKKDNIKVNEDTSDALKGKDNDKVKEDKNKREKKAAKEVTKRYVLFIGNLPIDVTREQILNHFSDIRDYIKDVRLPQLADNKKSSIAYVEFDSAPVYEMALSKHHSMMGRTRINVLYTTPNKKSKITKTEAKAKSAKLTAMAKKGQLVGSIPLTKKRSHRRAKARAFQRAAEKELNSIALN